MAANVFAAALRNSMSEGNDRNVLLALADCAWRDGVTWILVGDDKRDEDETICRLARVSRATVWRSLKHLVEAGEVQTVRVRRGRSFVTVYRVLHGAVDVDYERIPFDLPQRFGEPEPARVQRSNLQRSDSERVENVCSATAETVTDGERCNLQRSTGDGQRLTGTASTLHGEPVQRFTETVFNVSPSRVRDGNAGTVREPAAEPESERLGDPAAEQRPATDRQVTDAVLAFPGADSGSPRVVIPIAHAVPRSTFEEVVEKARQRRGGVGLLVDLLRLARAERTAALSAQLAAELGQHAPAYVPAPWLMESLKRDDPRRYVRIMAATPGFPLELLREAFHDRDDVDGLVELAERVRAGAEPGDRIGTPADERTLWVETHATDPDADAVIDAWDDVDPVERQELHELAERLRENTSTREAA